MTVNTIDDGLQLRVNHQDEINFIYQVVVQEKNTPSFMTDSAEITQDYQAEVFLREGGQNYDIIEWTQEDILQDVIDQYERHLHFLNLVRTKNQ